PHTAGNDGRSIPARPCAAFRRRGPAYVVGQLVTESFDVSGLDRAKTNDWSAERCTLSPFDDRWLTVSKGGKRVTWSGFIANTATSVPAKGSASRTGVTATRVGVAARACPTCASVTVTHAGVRLGTVSLKAPKATRVVVWLPTGKRRTGTLTLTAPSGATLDGVFLHR
ncbi:MAG: hypothetical protein ABW156_08965, partial [Jiangellaceae bacterium]